MELGPIIELIQEVLSWGGGEGGILDVFVFQLLEVDCLCCACRKRFEACFETSSKWDLFADGGEAFGCGVESL